MLIGDWEVSPTQGVITRGDEKVKLEPKVTEVLAYLVTRPGEVVSRDDIEQAVWPNALVGYESVTKSIIKLRKALGDDARNPVYIETIPKRGYRLIAPVQESSAGKTSPETRNSSRLAFAISGMVLLTVALVLVYMFMPESPSPDSENKTATIPSIIVLPFENLDETQQSISFADGMTEDIITDLSSISNLRVLASSTAFSLRERQTTVQELGKELSVDYVLQGSIRRLNDSIRINARLVDTRTGFQKWGKRYDRKTSEAFDVQDELTARMIEALAVTLSPQEQQRMARRTTNNLAAYDYFLEGQRQSKFGTRETNLLAEEAYKKAIDSDHNYGRAYGALAFTLAYRYRRGWTDTPIHTIDRAIELGKLATKLDDSIPQTFWSLGYAHMTAKEYEQAKQAVENAIAIAPNYADAYGLLALIKNTLGESEQAIELVKKGMQLNPYYTWDYPYNLGRAYYLSGQIDKAIESLEQARNRNENAVPIRLHLAASYARAGRIEDAEWEVEEIQILNPKETISLLKTKIPLNDPQDMQMFVSDLRKAGLPE